MEWKWNLYLAKVPDCKEKQTVKLAVRLSPLILGYSRQVKVYTRWFNHFITLILKSWWSLQSDWLLAVWLIHELHYFLF